jgi:hypothetical protein
MVSMVSLPSVTMAILTPVVTTATRPSRDLRIDVKAGQGELPKPNLNPNPKPKPNLTCAVTLTPVTKSYAEP